MAHIVIIGAGVTGVPMAHEVNEYVRPGDRITLVSEASNVRFLPSNPWGAVDHGEQGDVDFPIGPGLEQAGISFTAAGARRVHPDRNQLELRDGSVLDYDFLVIATGPRLAFDEVEGLGPKGYTQSVCHVDHAAASHKAWERFVAEPGPVVVGAVQGACCFGPAYECVFALEADLHRRNIRERAPITFVTAEPYIGHLGIGGVGASRTMLESAMREKGIRWIANARVARVEPERIHLSEYDDGGRLKNEQVLPFKYSMMMPAFKGLDAVLGIEGLTDARGFVLIDEFQRNPKFRNIYAAGVAVASSPAEPRPAQTDKPRTAYMIESMVAAVARNIRDQVDGREPSQTADWNLASLADLGHSGIAFVGQPQVPPRKVNWFADGDWVHLPRCSSCDVGD